MDRRTQVDGNSDGIVDSYKADIASANDYYPFGMVMPGRSYSIANTNYRYGFNGKEKDNSISSLTDYDYGFRIYNPALGKFLSVDPLNAKYAWNSPYAFAENDVIRSIDLDGLEKYYSTDGRLLGTIGTDTRIRVLNDNYLKALNEKVQKNGTNISSMFNAQAKSNIDQFSVGIINVSESVQKLVYKSNYSANTQKLLNSITKSEGGYVDDPTDKGGKTKYGIAENREWKTKNAAGILGIDNDASQIKKITKNMADYYYYQTRFAAYRINDITNTNIESAILNQSALTPSLINKNVRKSLNELGYEFKITSSQLNNDEVNALNSADPDKFINIFLDYQTDYYKSLHDKKHERGWLNRVNELRPKKQK